MYRRSYLQIPGPTNIPDPVLQALNHPAINHRGSEFAELLAHNVRGLKQVMQTENDILLFPSSGSGGLEAAIVNLLSPGDKVLAVNMGVFSQRMGQIAHNFGASVTWIEKEWGTAVTAADYRAVLEHDLKYEYKAVFVTHNETATGVLVDVESVRRMLDDLHHPALLVVDAVSSLAISDLQTDTWGVDVVVSASQKGLMLPGGLSVISVSPKAWAAQERATMPKWYWNFSTMRQRMAIGQMPYTPAINLFFGLEVALKLLQEEGMPNVFRRHTRNALAMQAGLMAMGLELLVENEAERSPAVTAVKLPANIAYQDLARGTEQLGVTIGGGLQRLEGKIFRVGHLGMLHEMEVIATLGALEMVLHKLGHDLQLGVATGAAMASYLQ